MQNLLLRRVQNSDFEHKCESKQFLIDQSIVETAKICSILKFQTQKHIEKLSYCNQILVSARLESCCEISSIIRNTKKKREIGDKLSSIEQKIFDLEIYRKIASRVSHCRQLYRLCSARSKN